VRKRIFIIENDEEIKQIVTYILELEGYDVVGSRYDSAALISLKADLILLDEWVNKREGHMLCTEIKAIEVLQAVPVVIFSTAPDIADIAKKCKADGFVHKPFDLDTLIAVVKKLLPLPAAV
jgi:two-component system phosphate regulon response regulator PhoB